MSSGNPDIKAQLAGPITNCVWSEEGGDASGGFLVPNVNCRPFIAFSANHALSGERLPSPASTFIVKRAIR